MAENNILSQLQDLLKNTKVNDLIKQVQDAFGGDKKEKTEPVEKKEPVEKTEPVEKKEPVEKPEPAEKKEPAEKSEPAEKKEGGIMDIVKSVTKGDGMKNLSKLLNMLKSLQGGKIFGNLGKMAGMSSLAGMADQLQNSPEDTEEKENLLDELDLMVAVAIEDGVITEEEEAMLSAKAEELGLNVPEFIAEVRAKCAAAEA